MFCFWEVGLEYILSHCNAQQMHWNRSRKDMPLVFVPLFHLSSFFFEFPVSFKSLPTKVGLDFSNKKTQVQHINQRQELHVGKKVFAFIGLKMN